MKSKQSSAGYIREHIEEIERKISIRIRHESIIEELAGEGHPMNIGTFRNHLFRARQKALGKKGFHQEPVPPALPPTPAKAVNPLTKKSYDQLTEPKGFVWDPSSFSKDDLI